jgi:hypothetical protein
MMRMHYYEVIRLMVMVAAGGAYELLRSFSLFFPCLCPTLIHSLRSLVSHCFAVIRSVEVLFSHIQAE